MVIDLERHLLPEGAGHRVDHRCGLADHRLDITDRARYRARQRQRARHGRGGVLRGGDGHGGCLEGRRREGRGRDSRALQTHHGAHGVVVAEGCRARTHGVAQGELGNLVVPSYPRLFVGEELKRRDLLRAFGDVRDHRACNGRCRPDGGARDAIDPQGIGDGGRERSGGGGCERGGIVARDGWITSGVVGANDGVAGDQRLCHLRGRAHQPSHGAAPKLADNRAAHRGRGADGSIGDQGGIVDGAAAEEVEVDPGLGQDALDKAVIRLFVLRAILPLRVSTGELPSCDDAGLAEDGGDDVRHAHLLEDPRAALALQKPKARDDAKGVFDFPLDLVHRREAHGGNHAIQRAGLWACVEREDGALAERGALDVFAGFGGGDDVEGIGFGEGLFAGEGVDAEEVSGEAVDREVVGGAICDGGRYAGRGGGSEGFAPMARSRSAMSRSAISGVGSVTPRHPSQQPLVDLLLGLVRERLPQLGALHPDRRIQPERLLRLLFRRRPPRRSMSSRRSASRPRMRSMCLDEVGASRVMQGARRALVAGERPARSDSQMRSIVPRQRLAPQ